MDQLIANLGTTTKNSECTTIFDKVCPIGCNGRIGAEALLLDQCGICGGDGSTCASDDDDGSCGATCIGLAVGIPLGILFLLILAAGIICFSGAAARRRRRRRNRNTLPQRNVTGHISNKHYSTPIRRQQNPSNPTYAHPKRSKVTMTNKKRISKIRWTNGWGKSKYY